MLHDNKDYNRIIISSQIVLYFGQFRVTMCGRHVHLAENLELTFDNYNMHLLFKLEEKKYLGKK